MAINVKCPKCGGTNVQLSSESSKHGCFWFILLGWIYIPWVLFKWTIGLTIFCCYDWWMAIIHNKAGKGHVWISKRWFSGKNRYFYCHDCHHNFKG